MPDYGNWGGNFENLEIVAPLHGYGLSLWDSTEETGVWAHVVKFGSIEIAESVGNAESVDHVANIERMIGLLGIYKIANDLNNHNFQYLASTCEI